VQFVSEVKLKFCPNMEQVCANQLKEDETSEAISKQPQTYRQALLGGTGAAPQAPASPPTQSTNDEHHALAVHGVCLGLHPGLCFINQGQLERYLGYLESEKRNLGKACASGDIEKMRKLLIEGADINKEYDGGLTPLMHATVNNKTTVVSLLLTNKELVLEKATKKGYTALHFACNKGGASFPVIPLLGSDKRCTPVVLNKKDNEGDTPLMWAVMFGSLESLKEMEKLQGTDFRTENQFGEGLVDVALRRLRKKHRKEDYRSVLEYLRNRRKVESLKELAARAVACQISCETDVEKLGVPLILHPWVLGYFQTPRIMNIDSDRWSDTSDEDMDEDEGDSWWNTFSSNDEEGS